MNRTDETAKYTHYGWALFCPVRIGGIDSNTFWATEVRPRWMWLLPWFVVNLLVQTLIIVVVHLFHPDFQDDDEPGWIVMITGRIKTKTATRMLDETQDLHREIDVLEARILSGKRLEGEYLQELRHQAEAIRGRIEVLESRTDQDCKTDR